MSQLGGESFQVTLNIDISSRTSIRCLGPPESKHGRIPV